MSEEQEFKKRADAAMSLLGRDLAGAADDYGFQTARSGGAIYVDCGTPGGKISITCHPQAQQITLQIGARTYKLEWDVVEAAFVHTESGQNLRELVEQALTKNLRQEVSL
jgi:frataxin-like iron-binding protein CyaY